jgi:carbamoyltransferase
MVNVLGISAGFHDSAAAVVRDGRLAAAAAEERFTRVKHDASLPIHAVRSCLQQARLTLADIDVIAHYEHPHEKLARQLWIALRPEADPETRSHVILSVNLGDPLEEIRRVLNYTGRVRSFAHHHSHAASAFFCSGFDRAAALTADGVGEWTTTAYWQAQAAAIVPLETVDFPHSLGLLYSTITAYLGFSVNDDEYKVMGLAPYGEPRFGREMEELIEVQPRGQFQLKLEYFDFLRPGRNRMYSDALFDLFGRPAREPGAAIEAFHCDVARSLQVMVERVLLEKARYLHELTGESRLCLAGGVALNSVANGRLRREGPFDEIFIQPAAGDDGGAIGAACLGFAAATGNAPDARMTDALLGPGFSAPYIQRLLSECGFDVSAMERSNDDYLGAVARRLASGMVVGWFDGRMEFGPRALGARSILADPRVDGMRDRINTLVKKREAFRPFAPSVLLGQSSRHFEMQGESPFMLETCQVRSDLSMPAITHVDGSARAQTVREDSPFGRLLAAFFELTGCPVLLNTSFNVAGEPIVCTPEDAIRCFVRSDLDALALQGWLIARRDIPARWLALRDRPVREHTMARDTVYTLI